MDIAQLVSEEFVERSPDDRVSTLVGAFDDPAVNGVVVTGEAFEGVVTRRQLATSHHPPDEKVGSLVWHVPRLSPDEDVRKVARMMIDSDSRVLPVFEGAEMLGVVTVDAVLEAVQPFLDAVTVAQAASRDLVTLDPESTVGDALHAFREHHITHLPVVEDDSAVGILSLYDLTELTVRPATQSQGGDHGGTDAHGGEISQSSGRTHGGYGAREGELDRVLDLPVRDAMVSPVRTIAPEATLDAAVETMLDDGGSSLVVTTDGSPWGIVTKTDVLDALTWEAEGNRAVQVYNAELLDDLTYAEVVDIIESLEDKDHGWSILDAKVHLHEHDEKLRGTPLLLARVRLHTDGGLFIGSGEGYGAQHAINEARDVLERQIRDQKTHGQTKKPPNAEFWEKRFGWLLEE